jgi:hypothetical protein
MWFGDNIVRKIWDGEKTLFWEDIWVNGSSLKYMFGRLFDLCLDKNISITGMCWLGWGFGVNGWRWRRRLFAWEKDLWGDCWVVDAGVVLKVDTSNNLEWLPDLAIGYSVYRTYPILKILTPSELSAHFYLIWDKIVSSKVYAFAWQFVSDKLSTKSNLFSCGCLYNDSLLYSVGCDAMEDIHLNLSKFLHGLKWYYFLVRDNMRFFFNMQFHWHHSFVGHMIFAKILEYVWKQFG